MSRGSALNAEIIMEIPKRVGYERVRLFRRNVAGVKVGDRFVRFGIKGMSDIFGVINIGGRGVALEIEGKVPPDRPSKEQLSWGNMIAGLGGIFIIATSVDDCERQLQYHIDRITHAQ